jgi:hypothetical protein
MLGRNISSILGPYGPVSTLTDSFIQHFNDYFCDDLAHWTENEKKRSFIFFSLFDLKIGHSADNFFFSVGNQFFFYLTT